MDNKLRLFIWKNSFILKQRNLRNTPITIRTFFTNYTGGGKKLKVTYEDNEYIFEEAMDKNYYILWSKDEFECSTVVIDTETKTAEIHNISNYKSCLVTTNIGSTLLRITLKMIEKYKDKFDVKKIIITDNSIKKCGKKDIQFAPMMILLTGDTWYGKYGFRPIQKELLEMYEKNKEIMNTIKLKDINLMEYLKKTKMSNELLELSHKFINKHQTMLLKDYLTKFIKDFNKTCKYFYDFYFTLFNDIGLYNFYRNTLQKRLNYFIRKER